MTAESSPGSGLARETLAWYRQNRRDLPWRRADFTAWGVLVSEFMLQQTPVARVVPRLEQWLARWPTPADLADESPGEAVRAWQSLGYPRRALWLHAAAVLITQRHGGIVPREVPELLALPGVGDYTARAVAVFAYGERHPVVDTNTRRVIARAVGGVEHASPPSTAKDLAAMTALLPESDALAAEFNAGLMELGALVCSASSPRCDVCPIRDRCAWRREGYPAFTGIRRTVQKPYAGSDRQVRGRILALLRSTHEPTDRAEIDALWPDAVQSDRALRGLVADGLTVESTPGRYVLP